MGLDEAHEMLVNRDCKAAVVHPNKEFISRIALYFPYHAKSIKNFKNQINPQKAENEIIESAGHIRKAGENIKAMNQLLSQSETLPTQSSSDKMVLTNGFTSTKADFLNFRSIRQVDFDAYVQNVYLCTGTCESIS